jgi:hypothetical protein
MLTDQRVEQLAAEVARLETLLTTERRGQNVAYKAEMQLRQAAQVELQAANARVEQLTAERDHLWELNELGKRCVSEAALAVELLLQLLEQAPSSEPPS